VGLLESESAEETVMSHTPGPWELDDYDERCNGWAIRGDELQVAVALYLGGTALAKRNARLIAAAPELLQELKRAKSVIEGAGYPVDSSITRAIAKAEGRS
jgi:hypothetical protein